LLPGGTGPAALLLAVSTRAFLLPLLSRRALGTGPRLLPARASDSARGLAAACRHGAAHAARALLLGARILALDGHAASPCKLPATDGNAAGPVARLPALREHHMEDAVLEARLAGVGLHIVRHAEGPLEAAVAPFGEMDVAALPFLPLLPLLAAYGKDAVAQRELDILLAHARQLGRDLHG